MPAPKKLQIVEELTERLARATITIGAAYQGLRVAEMNELRRQLRAKGVEIRVTKNTLLRLAAAAARQAGDRRAGRRPDGDRLRLRRRGRGGEGGHGLRAVGEERLRAPSRLRRGTAALGARARRAGDAAAAAHPRGTDRGGAAVAGVASGAAPGRRARPADGPALELQSHPVPGPPGSAFGAVGGLTVSRQRIISGYRFERRMSMPTAKTAKKDGDRVDQAFDLIKEMTILELRDLNKRIEEEFGVTAAAPVAMAMAPAAGPAPAAAAPAEEVEEQTEFTVVLKDMGAEQDQRHQGRPRGHHPGPQGGEGPGGERARQRQGRREQGRGGGGRQQAEGRRRHRRAEIVGFL